MTTKAAVGRPHAATSTVPLMPGLDGMRALAVMAVMVYHADNAWLPGGFIGVEVFFVISGYLITLLLIGEHERTGAISLRAFWARRARRLLPALYLLLSLLVIYTAIFRSDVLGQLRGDVIAALTYVSNWYQIWVGQSYTSSGDFAPLRHVWSLAVEEQFYLVWPLIMGWLLSRRSRDRVPDLSRWLLLAAVAITVGDRPALLPRPAGVAHRHAGRLLARLRAGDLEDRHAVPVDADPCDRPARRRCAGDAVAAAGGVARSAARQGSFARRSRRDRSGRAGPVGLEPAHRHAGRGRRRGCSVAGSSPSTWRRCS